MSAHVRFESLDFDQVRRPRRHEGSQSVETRRGYVDSLTERLMS